MSGRERDIELEREIKRARVGMVNRREKEG